MFEFTPTAWEDVKAYDTVIVNTEAVPGAKPKLRRMVLTYAPWPPSSAHDVENRIASLSGFYVTKAGERNKAYRSGRDSSLWVRLDRVVAVQRHGDAPETDEQRAARQATAPAPMPAFAETVYFEHGGRTVSGEVRSTVTGGGEPDRVVVYSRDLGHTHRIDHGITVRVADLLPAPVSTVTPERQAEIRKVTDATLWSANAPAPTLPTVHAFGRSAHAAARRAACGDLGTVRGPADTVTCPECREILAQLAAAFTHRLETPEEAFNNDFAELVETDAPAPTLADDVAALRANIIDVWSMTGHLLSSTDIDSQAAMLARLDRIAGAVPQRATVPGEGDLWMHDCGATATGGQPRGYDCYGCRSMKDWRALYTVPQR